MCSRSPSFARPGYPAGVSAGMPGRGFREWPDVVAVNRIPSIEEGNEWPDTRPFYACPDSRLAAAAVAERIRQSAICPAQLWFAG